MTLKGLFQILLVILLLSPGPQQTFGQAAGIEKNSIAASKDAASQPVTNPEFAELTIPPLGLLIDLALTRSPLLREQTALQAVRESQLASLRNEWGRYLLFFSEVRFGSVDYVVAGINSDNTWRYNVGTRLQLSIFDALDQKNKKAMVQAQLDFENHREDELKRMIKDDVIRLWNKLVSYKEIVTINQDHIAAQASNLFYAEQQFKSGDIPLLEYARIKEISIKADQEYELAKKEFRETYLLLESLIGIPLSDVKPTAK